MQVSKYQEYLKSNEFSTNEKLVIQLLLDAANDWPKDQPTLLDFISDVERFLDETPNQFTLHNCLNNIDLSKNAWEAESLAQLIEIYKFYDGSKSLFDVLKSLDK
jgi:hypothetical protein